MLFNSNFFLYVFLPLLLVLYFTALRLGHVRIAVQNAGEDRKSDGENRKSDEENRRADGEDRRGRASLAPANTVLLIFSLIFYWWTSGKYIILLLLVAAFSWMMSLLIERTRDRGRRKLLLAVSVCVELGLLVYYKYLGFLFDNLQALVKTVLGWEWTWESHIVLPVGISFFIFQALSYVIDVYRETVPAQKSYGKVALYIASFPQLVAGPIVRYETVAKEISGRESRFEDIYSGACRFCLGLGKKVLVADLFGSSVDSIFKLSFHNLTAPLAWSGLFLYTLQIYNDFSAYSDMAIGLGRIFGFHFNENFILPYSSKNITEFWRRWHISLSTFLKDYLYIPLGGNRKGAVKMYRNLFCVFLACGIWHGAAWTFVVWGIYHGFFIVTEKLLKNRYGFQMKGVIGNVVTFLIVMFGWLIFRAESLHDVGGYLKVLFGLSRPEGFWYYTYSYYVYPKVLVVAAVAAVAAIVPFSGIREKYRGTAVYGIAALVSLALAMMFVSNASFTPFIYFQF